MKALCVFSGGLDSILSAKIIQAQGIEVLGVFFSTPFFGPARAKRSAKSIGLPLKVVDITEPHLEMLRSPKHGMGKHMNPCIDCHALMCKVAGQLMDKEGASFVITGEVLGQRPMSQNKQSLMLVAKDSGLDRLLLRPLSAKHLPITIPEEEGWVDRELLLDFKGRSRKPQMELAEKLGIRDYPSPAGGCLLTEEVFARRLKDLISQDQLLTKKRIEMLKLGRHFRFGPKTRAVVGRNERENQILKTLMDKEDVLLQCQSIPGPVVVVWGEYDANLLKTTAELTAAYSDSRTSEQVAVRAVR
ncbi:MAG: tRNA 4-thiouridine(8) synthase ThiI, partial [Deltaproteobacteria bacterium]